jgi:hypothetical protein
VNRLPEVRIPCWDVRIWGQIHCRPRVPEQDTPVSAGRTEGGFGSRRVDRREDQGALQPGSQWLAYAVLRSQVVGRCPAAHCAMRRFLAVRKSMVRLRYSL